MTEQLRVAPLQKSHRSELESIVRATEAFSEEEVGVAMELFDEQSDYEFTGAFQGDRLVGYVCFGATPATDRAYDLYWIAVHPEAQRSGAGSALVAEVERRLKERSARLLAIETSSRGDYAPTREFYHKHGYQEAARVRDFYAIGDDRVVLTKRLTDVPVSPPAAAPGDSPLPATRI